jgi:predicted aspartyl protease
MTTRSSLSLWIWAFLALTTSATALERGPSAEEVLKSRGLSLSGQVYVLDAESDAGLKKKLEAANALRVRFGAILLQFNRICQADWNLKEIDALSSALRLKRDDIQRQIDQIWRDQARNNRNNLNSDQLTVFRGLEADRDDHNKTLNGLAHERTLIQGAMPAFADRKTVESGVNLQSGVFSKSLIEARQVVDPVLLKYSQLSRDVEVKKALESVRRASKSLRSLGPSAAFKNLLSEIERNEAMVWTTTLKPKQEGNQFWVPVTFNSKETITAVLDPSAASITVSAKLAEKMGLKPTGLDPTVPAMGAKGKRVQARRVFAPSIRLGPLIFANVAVAVLPETEGDIEPGLGQSLHLFYAVVPESGDLVLVRAGATPSRTKPGGTKKSRR